MERRTKFKRMTSQEMVAGVCAGLAYWLGIPTWLVRSIWLASALYYGIGVGLYCIFWICVPQWNPEPNDYDEVTD